MNNDLISRERLKNTILLGNYDTQSKILSAIDNAPTVTPSLNLDNITKEDIEKFKTIWQRATSKGLPTFIEDRPQGEWAEFEGGYRCSNCDDIEVYTPNFCPNCGAKMKGGKE